MEAGLLAGLRGWICWGFGCTDKRSRLLEFFYGEIVLINSGDMMFWNLGIYNLRGEREI